jgi:hypothetical protein
VSHGVEFVVTEYHLNRTAPSGCVARLVGHLLHFALGAEAWMPPVMPEDYH